MTIGQGTDNTSLIETLKMRHFFTIFILVIFCLVLPSKFVVSDVESSGYYLVLILNVILCSIWFTYILIGGLSVTLLYFKKMSSKQPWISHTKNDQSGNLKFLFHVGADILVYSIYSGS